MWQERIKDFCERHPAECRWWKKDSHQEMIHFYGCGYEEAIDRCVSTFFCLLGREYPEADKSLVYRTNPSLDLVQKLLDRSDRDALLMDLSNHGVRSGLADWTVVHLDRQRFLSVEVKTWKGSLTSSQIECLGRHLRRGGNVAVVRSPTEFIEAVGAFWDDAFDPTRYMEVIFGWR